MPANASGKELSHACVGAGVDLKFDIRRNAEHTNAHLVRNPATDEILFIARLVKVVYVPVTTLTEKQRVT
jgi:hypothetical protein